ncbi:MAG TPA: hypothetical protein PL033_02175 [Candidatus Brocadiia bacterium]|nr:hypothetical protein [Candidatus Brocadiia bacterium]
MTKKIKTSEHAAPRPAATRPASGHPGNVFVEGEDIAISAGHDASAALHWRVLDDCLTPVGEGATEKTDTSVLARLGRLGAGWYRLEFLTADGNCAAWTNIAVLRPLAEPSPEDSPVCIDAALSWLAKDDATNRENLARLASFAGAAWIRDRLTWREVQPTPDAFVPDTIYDSTAAMQRRLGLNVLQVFHTFPAWARERAADPERPGMDLRDVYAFCKAMAARFSGSVAAWEPWNEGNARSFGGWTISEMCSHQKAAFLGFKAACPTGSPGPTVGWSPMGGINTAALAKGVIFNETWPYFDTYNIHSYDWPEAYENLWRFARDAASGRPIWVTECDRGIESVEGSGEGDLSHEFDLRKAEFMAQSYASSLYAGSSRHFHFILGHYMEGRIQFGLLRRDLTPRPSYVAFAALGRFLSGAKCLGRLTCADGRVQAIAFRAKPDGRERDVIVAWAETPGDWAQRGRCEADFALPESLRIESVHDYLGRPLDSAAPLKLRPAAVFIIMPPGEAAKLSLTPPPVSNARSGSPSPVVMQADIPGARVIMTKEGWTEEHDYSLLAGSEVDVRISVYNFSEVPAKGRVSVAYIPDGWNLSPSSWDVEVEPMGRTVLAGCLSVGTFSQPETWIRIGADMGQGGKPALAFRIRPAERE